MELLWVVLNYVTCVPVLVIVGAFRYLRSIPFFRRQADNRDSLYHFYCIIGNTTTIEGWEKEKVATLIRRGKIRQVKFPYVCITLPRTFPCQVDVTFQNLGARRNIESMLGTNPLLWCCPNVGPLGTGLKYQLAESEGKWVELSAREPEPREPEYHEYPLAHV